MTVIAQDAFTLAMTLMDELSEDGTFDGYPDEYKKKAWPILTLLQAEILGPDVPPVPITSELTVLLVDDRSAITILPYGLAAHLLDVENPNKPFYNDRYEELKRNIYYPVTSIQNNYDIFGVGQQEQQPDQSTIELDGGSFLDPNNVIYDRGEF
jgi:hypothetical protein